ncbi:hypothetical protein J6590_091632 [Homalodisca vitripennis]|nr:hypothetical protein J6590_091632 [Homalodisca vitripennis]
MQHKYQETGIYTNPSDDVISREFDSFTVLPTIAHRIRKLAKLLSKCEPGLSRDIVVAASEDSVIQSVRQLNT